MTQPLNIFNETGLRAFKEAYQIAANKQPKEFMDVSALINDRDLTTTISTRVDIQPERFKNGLKSAQYFAEVFKKIGNELSEHKTDPLRSQHLWAWLSAVWSDILQRESDGSPAKKLTYGYVGEEARWIYQYDDAQRWYRHLLASPYRIYSQHDNTPNDALILLDVDIVHPNTRRLETICGSPNVYAHKSLVADLSRRFMHPTTGRLRDDIDEFEDRDKNGSFDRLIKVLNQLNKNYDLHQLSPQQLELLTPDELNPILTFAK